MSAHFAVALTMERRQPRSQPVSTPPPQQPPQTQPQDGKLAAPVTAPKVPGAPSAPTPPPPQEKESFIERWARSRRESQRSYYDDPKNNLTPQEREARRVDGQVRNITNPTHGQAPFL